MPTTFERPATTGGTPSGSSAVSGEIPAGSRGDVTEVVCGFRPTVVSVDELGDNSECVTIRIGQSEVNIFSSMANTSRRITLIDNGFRYEQTGKDTAAIYYTAMP